jgi:hypothetical protein
LLFSNLECLIVFSAFRWCNLHIHHHDTSCLYEVVLPDSVAQSQPCHVSQGS